MNTEELEKLEASDKKIKEKILHAIENCDPNLEYDSYDDSYFVGVGDSAEEKDGKTYTITLFVPDEE